MELDLKYKELQRQYDLIYSFFKTTTEPFDCLDWDGETLAVVFEDVTIEEYMLNDLKELILEL
jgi:hypothetical protein